MNKMTFTLYNIGMSDVSGYCYFRNFNESYHRENLHLILSSLFSYPRLNMEKQFKNMFV